MTERHPALPVLATTGHGASKRGSHQLASVLQCPRKWYFRYRARIREACDLEFRMAGTLGHQAIAHAYAERIIEQDKWPIPTWWEDGRSLDSWLEEVGKGWPGLIPTARELYDAYKAHWWTGDYPEPWEPVAVEEQFYCKLVDLVPDCPDELRDEVITCGVDLVFRNTNTGQLWIADHKSKGFDWFSRSSTKRMEPWHKDGEQYTIHWQALVNLHIVRRAFPNEVVAGFIINRFTRKKPFLFDRHPLHVSPRVYEQAPRVLQYCIEQERRIDGMVAAGRKPEPHFWACHGKYGCCDYISLCNADDEEQANRIADAQFVVL